MSRQIFVNLPVENLHESISFFKHLGFSFNPQFTDENATCMVIGENIYAMLLVKKFFKAFTKKEIIDAKNHVEVLLAISAHTRAEVDQMVDKAVEAGGKEHREKQDHGWMYSRAFEDPDGHVWEVVFMDATQMPEEMKEKGE